MKVVVAGLGKTGTTALFHKILPAMPPGTRQLFEPPRYVPQGEAHTLAKILVGTMPEADVATFAGFDKKVLILRDVRDQMVSRLLYTVYNRPTIWRNPAQASALVELFRRKERDPHAVSVLDIVTFYVNAGDKRFHADFVDIARGVEFFKTHQDYFHITYDDMIADRLGPLGHHLGFTISPGAMSDSVALKRVARSRGSGDWRSWFTESDVAHFRPLVGEAVRAYGFGDDWSLVPKPVIDPATSSAYVEKLIEQARLESLPPPFWKRLRSRVNRLMRPRT